MRHTSLPLALALALLPSPGRAEPEGWLGGAPPEARPATDLADPGEILLASRGEDLEDVLNLLIGRAFPDGSVTSALPRAERHRKVSLQARGRFEHVLEALGAAADLRLVRQGSTIQARGLYQAPPARPPTEAELRDLGKQVQLRAADQSLGHVVQVLATFAGKMAVIPATEFHRKVTVNLRGNLAQGLEALGAAHQLRLWVDGPLLRVARRCVHRGRAYARPPKDPGRLVSLRAQDQELAKVTNILATFWGDTIAVIDPRYARVPVTVSLEDATPVQVTAALEGQLEGAEVFVDGPFLRVQPQAPACPPAPTGAGWDGLETLLYR